VPEYPRTRGRPREAILDRLGCYVMPGGSRDPVAGLAEATVADRLGLGSVWLSERWAAKELGSIAGAIAASTTGVRIVAGITHFATRHPITLAGLGTTLQALSGGRFALGVGRSLPNLWPMLGLPTPTLETMHDYAWILRDIWSGKTVSYSGPAGEFPHLRASDQPDIAPPALLLAAIGPKTLALAGRAFDGVILHPFLTPDAVTRSRSAVRAAAAAAGRDPDSVAVYGEVVVAPGLTGDAADRIIAARALTYFDMRGLAEALFTANGWDPDVLRQIRAHPLMQQVQTFADHDLSIEQRVQIVRDTVPDSWIAENSGAGDPAVIAQQITTFLDAGLDELVLHGASAPDLEPVLAAYTAAGKTSTA
jgi:5,10-methylenetetrahydromethanopterin reductase